MEFLLRVTNDPDSPNSCFMFSLEVLQVTFEMYGYKNQPKSKLFKQSLEGCLGSIFPALVKTFYS